MQIYIFLVLLLEFKIDLNSSILFLHFLIKFLFFFHLISFFLSLQFVPLIIFPLFLLINIKYFFSILYY